MVQISHPYMATGKTVALTRWTFVGKVMSLLFAEVYTQLLCVTDTEQQNTVPFLKVCGGGKNVVSNYYV